MAGQLCAYCRSECSSGLEEKVAEELGPAICASCYQRQVAPSQRDPDFVQFLASLPPPCVVASFNDLPGATIAVDHEARVFAANAKVQVLLAKSRAELDARLAGEIVGCRYAKLPGGCGNTVHCRSCAIRRTVTDTYRSGRPLSVGAFVDQDDSRKICVRISTRKVGASVLVKIENVRPA